MENTKKYLTKFWPEFASVILAIANYCFIFNLEISREMVENISSLGSQLLGVYLGLALTTFAIYHGLNIRDLYQNVLKNEDLTEEEKNFAHKLINNITDSFKLTIIFISIGTMFGFIAYLLSILSKNNNDYFSSNNPNIPNAIIISIILGFVINSTLNVIATIKTILILRD